MSQREHVTHTASSQVPRSPPAALDDTSPTSHHGPRGERPHEAAEEQFSRPRLSSSVSEIDRHAQARQSTVFNILNPAASQAGADPGASQDGPVGVRHGSQAQQADRARLSLSPPQPVGFPEGAIPQLHHHHHHHHHRQPMSGRSVSTSNVTDRSPPAGAYSGLSSEASRRILTPRSPRSLSTSHSASIRPLGQTLGQLPTSATGRRLQDEATAVGRFESSQRVDIRAPGSLGPLGGRPSPSDSFATPARPQSQPMVPPVAGSQTELSRQPQGPTRFGLSATPTPPSFGGPTFTSYSPSIEQGWAMNTSGPGPSRPSVLTGTHPGDSQLSFAINPVGGERMVIPVETYSGSRQADEKRQRNAGASARFRKRKKTKEEANVLNIQRLEKDVRDLEHRVQEMQAESDRLRADRDRLRDLVHRTPEISYMAFHGPQSPASSRSALQIPGRSPLAVLASPSLPAGAPYGAADPLTGERASRRRRTEPSSETTMTPYSVGQPVLPALTSPSYQSSHPGTPLSITRPPSLPPLSGLTPPPSSGPSSFEPGPPTSAPFQPATYRREAYETGWAVGSSESRTKPENRRP
ncbi:uncharacterized protein B0I36DRAFT_73577 [Microdochium trichocladiopsis]|uniref:BZIP domain-containing protein n=1 Tax=Microdochium trichocladiopsis TaxID=1682393 RepID=A0A9P8YEI4_9PEZI|nr:uncharacterized protein B0I36DRAFT_73577 [Microdochium trichocladiopsis]KAH7037985.1 hypothetical protein B0I36DRAFT_73577 [Microdochium trichocladiopsis]